MAQDYAKQPVEAQPGSKDEEILKTMRARLKQAEDAERDIRAAALEDLEFRAGRQWPDAIRADRDRDGRPCLVINRIPQFIQQVTNDQRQNRPAIKVHPVDDKADIETAKVIQGLIRHIEYNSNADVAYDTAFDSAVTGGFGYFRILTDYSRPESFDQDIFIRRIRNPHSVYFDPFSQEPDGSDADWAFVVEDLSKEEYESQFGESKLARSDWEVIGNHEPDWIEGSSCRVAEYFYKEWVKRELVQLSDGQVIAKEEYSELALSALSAGVEPPQVIASRVAHVPQVKWCKTNGIEILERRDWPGRFIPIVPVYGTELYIDGKRTLEGIVRNAKDAQRMLNYWKSAETETIALAPRAPFIVAEGQLAGYESLWKTANRSNHAYLPYKPKSLDGTPVPPPQRQAFEPATQAITQAAMLAADDLKATTGIYDAALGARSNEQSGVAIQRRSMQAQTSNFHFMDNLVRSIKHAGRIIIDLIPHVYDAARAARIVGDEGDERIVQLNAPTEDRGKKALYAMDVGIYDCTVAVGPSFASKRQEAAQSMVELSKANPAITQIAGDLMVKNMDWPGAAEIAERLKKALPPGLAEDQKQGGEAVPPQVQAQIQQMSQLIEQLTEQLKAASDDIRTKRVELESKERIEMAKLENQATIELAKLQSGEAVRLLALQVQELDARTKMLGIQDPMDDFSGTSDMTGTNGGFSAGAGSVSDPTGGASPGLPMNGEIPQ